MPTQTQPSLGSSERCAESGNHSRADIALNGGSHFGIGSRGARVTVGHTGSITMGGRDIINSTQPTLEVMPPAEREVLFQFTGLKHSSRLAATASGIAKNEVLELGLGRHHEVTLYASSEGLHQEGDPASMLRLTGSHTQTLAAPTAVSSREPLGAPTSSATPHLSPGWVKVGPFNIGGRNPLEAIKELLGDLRVTDPRRYVDMPRAATLAPHQPGYVLVQLEDQTQAEILVSVWLSFRPMKWSAIDTSFA